MSAQRVLGHGLGQPLHQSEFLFTPHLLPPEAPKMASLTCPGAVLGLHCSVPYSHAAPSAGAAFALVWSCATAGQEGPGQTLSSGWGTTGTFERNWPESQTALICFFSLGFGNQQLCVHPSGAVLFPYSPAVCPTGSQTS